MANSNKAIGLISILLLLIAAQSNAQQAQWAKFFGGRAGSKGREIQTDLNGNIYSVGDYSFSFNTGAVDFDPGPALFTFTQPTNTGSSYISKLDANGNFIWARSFTNNGVSGASINNLCLDAEGNVLISGTFVGTVDFNLGAGVFNVTSYAPTTYSDSLINDFYLAKYSSSGNFLWVKTFSCEPLDIFPNYVIANSFSGLCMDGQNNIILTGNFRGRVDLNPGIGEEWKESGGLNYSSIAIKLNNQGDFVWGKQLAGGDNISSAVVVDHQNNIYINGAFSQNIDIDPGPAENWIGNHSFSDSYILKLNSNGDFQWYNRIHGPTAGYGGSNDIAIDGEGNVLATGAIVRDSLYFKNATENLLLLKSNSFTETGNNAFVAKIDSNGHYLWIKQMASDTELGVSGNSIACDSVNNVYVCGTVSDSADFDYSGNGALLHATGDYSTFLMKLDEHGNYIRTSLIDGDKYVSCADFSLDEQANIYFTGFFHVVNLDPGMPWATVIGTGQIDFDPGPDTLALIGLGNGPETVFVAKWNQCNAGTTTTNETACDSYTWNNETYTQSGMYSKSLTTSNGCDSIARLNLTVLSSVQWFQDVQICAGETFNIGNQTLTQSGIYETLLTAQNGCDSTVTTTLMVLPPSISTQEVELCAGETYTINGETYSEAGVYSTTFQNSNGCDSTVTTSIVIDEIQVQVVLEEDTFTAVNFPTDATLQWVDCANDFSALENETSPVFNPSASGSYAVVVSNGECSETSSCENIIITSVDHLARNGELRAVVFPNPFEGDVELRLSGFSWPTHFTIFNTTGQAIRTGNITQDIVLLSLHGLATGLYTIKLEDSQGLSVTKNLVKE